MKKKATKNSQLLVIALALFLLIAMIVLFSQMQPYGRAVQEPQVENVEYVPYDVTFVEKPASMPAPPPESQPR